MKNWGQKTLNPVSETSQYSAGFQIAAVHRPLMSVGKICDEGHKIAFDKTSAVVTTAEGLEVCRFERSQGGLYVAKLKLRNPLGFARQE